MNLANLLSLFRVASLPLIIYLLSAELLFWAIIVLTIAIITDVLDGYVARRQKTVSKVGSFLDPFADKILVVGLLLTYSFWGSFWWWVLALFIARDTITLAVRWLASQDDVTMEEIFSGKMITYPQIILVFILILRDAYLYDMGIAEALDSILLLATAVSVVISFLSVGEYTARYLHGLRSRIGQGKQLASEKLVILANRRSSGYRDVYRRRLLKIFARRRKANIIYLPRISNMYKGIQKRIGNDQHIIIAGGDGSFESALNYKPFWKHSLGFFPLGAGNAYYSYFYTGKRFEYLRSRFPFREMPLDVLEISWDGGALQTTFLSLGVDADVIRLSKDDRTQHGLWDYIRGSWKAVRKAKADYDFRCIVDGKKHSLENCANVTIAKIPYYGFSLRSILSSVKPCDGSIYGLAVVNRHSPLFNKAVRIWALCLAALRIDKSPLLALKGRKFTITSDIPFPLQAGGEFLGYTQKVTVRVARKQKVLVI